MTTDDELRTLLSDLVSTASKFTRLASSISTDTRPRTWIRALALLEEYGPIRINEFARIDRCSQPSATALLRALGTEGLVVRTTDTADSRAVVVQISTEGRSWLVDARYAIGDALLPFLGDVEPGRIERLARELDELRDAVTYAHEEARAVTVGD